MSFTIQGDYFVYKGPTRIYTEDAAVMRQAFKDAMEKGQKRFIVNFSDTEYIDSAGLGVLVSIQKRALEQSGSVKLVGVKGNVEEVFQLTRLTKVFEIHSSVQDI